MKKVVVLSVSLVVLCASFVNANTTTYQAAVAADSPSSYFSFDVYNSVNQAWMPDSGYGWVGGSGVMTAGISGNAIDIANGGRCNSDIQATTSFSQEIWLESDSSSYTGAALAPNPYQAAAGVLMQTHSSNSFDVFAGWGADYLGVLTVTNPNAWHQIVVTVSSSACEVYLDGQVQLTDPGFTAASYGDFDQELGGYPDAYAGTYGANTFNGNLDEYSVYNYALSADQVAAHYNAMYTPEPATMILLAGGALGLLRRRK